MSDLYQRLQMSDPSYQRDEVECGAPQDKFPVAHGHESRLQARKCLRGGSRGGGPRRWLVADGVVSHSHVGRTLYNDTTIQQDNEIQRHNEIQR